MSCTTKYPYVQYRIRWKVRRCAVRSAANGPAPGEWFAGCPVRRADKPAVLKPPAALSFSLLLLMPTTVHRRTPLPGHRDGCDSETCLTATFVVRHSESRVTALGCHVSVTGPLCESSPSRRPLWSPQPPPVSPTPVESAPTTGTHRLVGNTKPSPP